jgi:hypothetical protein
MATTNTLDSWLWRCSSENVIKRECEKLCSVFSSSSSSRVRSHYSGTVNLNGDNLGCAQNESLLAGFVGYGGKHFLKTTPIFIGLENIFELLFSIEDKTCCNKTIFYSVNRKWQQVF